jgi:hypothetical protein
MRTTAGYALWIVLAMGCFLPGCLIGEDLYLGAPTNSGKQSERELAVVEELGPVAILERGRPLLPKFRHTAKRHVQRAGYELRGSVDERTFKQSSGTIASVFYFTELKDDSFDIGAVKLRNSGHSKAIVQIGGETVGECTILEPVVGLSDVTYARPIALADGEQVPIGSVKVGPRHFNVISKCRHIGEQGSVSVFFNGRNRTIWNDYEIDGQVVAKRTCPPEEAVEFSPELNPEEQLSIAADMYFRLSEDRVAKRQKNTVFVPVYY